MNCRARYTLITFQVIILIGSVPTGLQALGDPEQFFNQEESTQHLLLQRGDRFRFFRFNLIITNPQLARFDPQTSLDDEPSILLDDQAEDRLVNVRWHHPLHVQPYTLYRLSWFSRVDALAGPGPFIELEHCDINNDTRNTQTIGLNDLQPQQEWRYGEKIFSTDRTTHALKFNVTTTRKGTCKAWFDRIYLEQLTAAGALKPPGEILHRQENVELTATGSENTLTQAIPLHTPGIVGINARIGWDDSSPSADLELRWLDEHKHVLYQDRCELKPVEGIEPIWNGLSIRWRRVYDLPTDKASFSYDIVCRGDSPQGTAKVAREFPIPPTVKFIEINVSSNKGLNGSYTIHLLELYQYQEKDGSTDASHEEQTIER